MSHALFSSVQFSPWVVSDSATPWTAARQGLCSSPTPGTCSNSRTSRQWCHPTISFSVVPFSSCLPSFPASGSFLMIQFSYFGSHFFFLIVIRVTLMAYTVKSLLTKRETQIQSSGSFSWRREWLPTAMFLPGEFHGQRSLEGYSPWGLKELDKTEQLTQG